MRQWHQTPEYINPVIADPTSSNIHSSKYTAHRIIYIYRLFFIKCDLTFAKRSTYSPRESPPSRYLRSKTVLSSSKEKRPGCASIVLIMS